MNGAHDLGGMHGFGPVAPDPNEPLFHDAWERRCFALTLAAGFTGQWNLDMSRFAREKMPPAEYLATSYYEHWLFGLEELLVDKGLVSREEIEAGRSLGDGKTLGRILKAENVAATLLKGGPVERETNAEPAFKVSDAVKAKNINPTGHTRLPRYARGRRGVIDRIHGCHVYPDAHARGDGEDPRFLYSVKFSAEELWGPDGEKKQSVFIDLWEPYLEPA